MNKFINPRKINHFKDLLTSFSEENKFMFIGLAKSFTSKKYKWIADYLFKHRTNIATNTHKAWVSFFSDKETVYQDYSNIAALYEQYPFLQEYEKAKLSPYSFELSSKQYNAIGQKYSDADVIKYINASEKVWIGFDPGLEVIFPPLYHPYKDSAIFHAEGYRAEYDPGDAVKFIWVDKYLLDPDPLEVSGGTGRSSTNISDFIVHNGADIPAGSYQEGELTKATNSTRVVDYKIQVDHKNYFYFENSDEWVVYHSKLNEFIGNDLKPYFGAVTCYQDKKEIDHRTVPTGEPDKLYVLFSGDIISFIYKNTPGTPIWQTSPYMGIGNKITYDTDKIAYIVAEMNTLIDPYGFKYQWRVIPETGTLLPTGTSDYLVVSVTHTEYNLEVKPDNIYYLPDVFTDGKVEPSKIIIKWPFALSGKVAFNPGCIPGSIDDQSRLIFNTVRAQYSDTDYDPDFSIYKEVAGNSIYNGIDLDTERNKHHYATVMTEPYFTTKAINNGKIINYKLINSFGDDAYFFSGGDFGDDPSLFLKIKTDISVITEIDQILNTEDYNADIIHTLIIKDPKTVLPDTTGDEYYKSFYPGNKYDMYERQEDDVTDLLYGKYNFPAAKHMKFTINNYNSLPQYSDKLIVNGLGFYTDTRLDDSGAIIGWDEYLSIYCSNHCMSSKDNAPEEVVFMSNASSSNIYKVEQYEKFKPLIKINGINGYVKILKKNKHFPVTISSDGFYEVVYNIEFPYCPGSYSSRIVMDYTSGYRPTQILKKQSYIPAGSWLVNSSTGTSVNTTYEIGNERNILTRDNAFTYFQLAGSGDPAENIRTQWASNGGGWVSNVFTGTSPSILSVKSYITYPNNRSLTVLNPKMLSVDTGEFSVEDKAYTYQSVLEGSGGSLVDLSESYQLFLWVDNRKWFFDNKYESYINRENPSYVFEIDAAALYNEYTQKNNYAIPDLKRWLYAYFIGNASMGKYDYDDLINSYLQSTIDSFDSKSDIMIDIWDKTTNADGNWRSISPSQYDNDKLRGTSILDGLYRDGAGTEITGIGCWTFTLKYYNPPTGYYFPANFDTTLVDGVTNKVLYDAVNKVCYHGVWIVCDVTHGTTPQYLTVTIKYDPYIYPALDTTGNLELLDAQTMMNKYENYELYSSRVISKAGSWVVNSLTGSSTGLECRLINKFIDIRKTGDLTDFDRYIDADNKLYFRVRVNRGKEYPTTKVNIDNDDFQYITDNPTIYSNNPWYPGGVWDTGFDYSKVGFLENVLKLSNSYFKISSK